MPRLQVLAGPCPNTMVPITANSNKPYPIKSHAFEGEVVVHIKGFPDEDGNVLDSEYFAREDRKGVTWSIQVQGRFLQPHSADDIMFGNSFDRPLKLPWGSSAALKFMNFIDPTLEHDLTSQTKPWALSPLISTMPNFSHTRLTSRSPTPPPFPSPKSIGDDTSQLDVPAKCNGGGSPRSSSKRRAHFSQAKNRKQVVFGPHDLITTDFCYGFISFPALTLNLPGGISFDLMKYWDGQPVRFVCCERPPPGQAPGVGNPFWCVAIVKVDDDDEDSERGSTGSGSRSRSRTPSSQGVSAGDID